MSSSVPPRVPGAQKQPRLRVPKALTKERTSPGVTIGTLGALIGVSPTTMRFYEEKGIVKPEKDAENSYRRYRPAESCALLMARRCQGFGLSLERTTSLVTGGTVEDLVEALSVRERELALEVARLRRSQLALRHYLGELRATQDPDQVVAVSLPSFKFVFTIEAGYPVDDPRRLALAQRWMRQTSEVTYAIVLPEATPTDQTPGCRWGFAKRAEALRPHEVGLADLYPGCECAALNLLRDRADRFCPEEILGLRDRFVRAGYPPRGPLRGAFLTIVGPPGSHRYLYRIYAPIYR